MGSRIRECPERVFELFVEIARPATDDEGKDPFILQKFPDDYDDEGVLKSLPQFAFPCSADSIAVDHFTFVLTDVESKFRFGFCRHAAGSHTCLCIISYLPWYEIFYKLLNSLAEIMNKTDGNLLPLLQAVYKQEVAQAGTHIDAVTPDFKDRFSFITPDLSMLPTIPENRNLLEYYNAVDVNNMMIIFASMLQERRILITSKKLSRLTACVHGSASLIYPMYWQHLYIPVLPKHLLDYCSAPMPYLIGIHSSLYGKIRQSELGDAVILDADRNTVHTVHDDLGLMPPEITSSLRKHLKMQQSDRMKTSFMGDSVARAFLRALVRLIGGYRDALKLRPEEQITFDPDAFMQSRPPSMQPFLENVLHLQIFEQFIKDRLDSLNSGNGFSDEFEMEANLWADKLNSNTKYREWLKKQGKKIRREGKDKLVELSSRVKDRSKTAVKNIRTKLDEFRKEEDDDISVSYNRGDPTPINSPGLRRERPSLDAEEGPPRPPAPTLANKISGSPYTERTRNYKLIDVDSPSSEYFADDFRPISINLMEDPDIQQAMKKSLSTEDIPDELKQTDSDSSGETVQIRTSILNYQHSSSSSRTSDALLDKPIPPPRTKKRSSSTTSPSSDKSSPTKTGIGKKHEKNTDSGRDRADSSVTLREKNSVRNSVSRDQPLIRLSFDADVSSSNSENSMDTIGIEEKNNANNIQFHGKCTDFDPLNSKRNHLKKQGVDVYGSNEDVAVNVYPKYRKQSNDDLNVGKGDGNAACDYLSQSVPASGGESFMRFAAPGGSNVNQFSTPPKPLPRNNSRNSVQRQEAFYNARRPSVPRPSPRTPQGTENQSIKNARTAFLQSEVPRRPASVAIDSFDPLVSGQVAVDSPSRAFVSASSETVSDSTSSSSGGGGSNEPQEDDLLKEWNLDFSRMRITASSSKTAPPPVPPKPNLPQGVTPINYRHSMYVPGYQTPGMTQMHGGYHPASSMFGGNYPVQTVTPLQQQPMVGGATVTPFSQSVMNPMQGGSVLGYNSPIKSVQAPGSMAYQAAPPMQRVSPIPHVARPTPPIVPPHPSQQDVLKARNTQNVQLVDLSVNDKPTTKNTWETFD